MKWINSLSVESDLIDLNESARKGRAVAKQLQDLVQTADLDEIEQEEEHDIVVDHRHLLLSKKEFNHRPNHYVKPVPRPINRTRNQPTTAMNSAYEMPPHEIVLTIAVFCGGDYQSEILVELDVLGSQSLAGLRDALLSNRYCISNRIGRVFSGGIKDAANPVVAAPADVSGYFYIEGCFYNDLRERSAKDYSKDIVDWVSADTARLQQFGVLETKTMESKFFDLSIRINHPYLYTHQGKCEHVLIFRDVRMMHSSDDSNLMAYPKTVWQSKRAGHHQKCQICERFIST
ncbi:UNVERIFIED_CONTAM: hypothetical protein HDU68_004137 [Siphonaria sp. JEL0065]|nr:hypothetical protein HDU68_004137 [Siphonaria sp. JEL0065]